MRVTVLWEDRSAVGRRNFGAGVLLVECVKDELGVGPGERIAPVDSLPKKGNGGVLAALRKDVAMLANAGPVFAVLDRDRAHRLWEPNAPACITGVVERLRRDAPGKYDVVLLDRNMETLIEVSCRARAVEVPATKPSPEQRDLLLEKAARSGREVRRAVRAGCPSFDRLVTRLAAKLRS